MNIVYLISRNLLFVAAATTSLPAMSAVLTGSGDLPFPGDTGAPNSINPTYVDASGSFSGTWDSTAAIAWQGTFTGTPDRITSANPIATNTMNFSGLTNGALPVNTFFRLGDLDQGSQSGEIITLRAWDKSNVLITTPWLDEPTHQVGTDVPQLASMLPDFVWDSVTGTYIFDGNGETFPGNPTTSVFMVNNQEILNLEVDKQTAFANFGISAPTAESTVVPVPAAIWFFGSGLIGLIGIKKNRYLN